MSESIAEMIIPGTYIEVRAEGLISVGSIATGNIGVVGTASRGPAGEIVPLGSYSDAIDTFGARSEEHTSELQSHSDLVCRLLLEKKKKKNTKSDTLKL